MSQRGKPERGRKGKKEEEFLAFCLLFVLLGGGGEGGERKKKQLTLVAPLFSFPPSLAE